MANKGKDRSINDSTLQKVLLRYAEASRKESVLAEKLAELHNQIITLSVEHEKASKESDQASDELLELAGKIRQ